MEHGLTRDVKKFRDLKELSLAAASDIAELIVGTVSRKGHFSLALSGGGTPRTLHGLLGSVYRDKIPWESVYVYFGDERYVPHTDRQSNYLMAKETLLDLVPISPVNVHPIPTDLDVPSEAAAAYERELRRNFGEGDSSFDLILLGMGGEGHTASLFPGSPALDEIRRWVMSAEVPATPHTRVTLTYPIINRAFAVYFLVSGADKREALREVLGADADYHTYPAKGVAPFRGRLEWWVDSAALMG